MTSMHQLSNAVGLGSTSHAEPIPRRAATGLNLRLACSIALLSAPFSRFTSTSLYYQRRPDVVCASSPPESSSSEDGSSSSGAGRKDEQDALQRLLADLALQPNVKISAPSAHALRPGDAEGEDEDEDAESWDEIMEDLEDPWMAFPSMPEGADEDPPPVPSAATPDTASTSGAPISAYESPIARIGYEDVVQLVARSQLAEVSSPSWSSDAGEVAVAGEPGRWQGPASNALLLDVREPKEFSERHIPTSVNIPMSLLRGDTAAALASKTVVVVGSGDMLSLQACIRLTRVYRVAEVFHYGGGLGDYFDPER